MLRIISLLIGYVLGLIQSGYIVGRLYKLDIREHGSKNPGATNALRVLGKKAGAMVFLGDFLKSLIPCLAISYIFRDNIDLKYVLLLYMGLGVVLGHNYPFYLGFKGGKGVASTAGILTALDIRIALILLLIFIAVTVATKYISLASIFVMLGFIIISFFYSGFIRLSPSFSIEFRILCIVISLLSIWRHRSNIVRLINGKENKINLKK